MLNNIIPIIYCYSITVIAINLLCRHTLVTVFCYICRRRFSERILMLFDKSSKKMTVISPQGLVDCTAEVSARYSVGVRPQASLAAICRKAGIDLDNVAIS
jgi:hypothetical protein